MSLYYYTMLSLNFKNGVELKENYHSDKKVPFKLYWLEFCSISIKKYS